MEVNEILDECYLTDDSIIVNPTEIGWLNAIENGNVISSEGGTSGGYAEYIVKRFTAGTNKTVELKRTIKWVLFFGLKLKDPNFMWYVRKFFNMFSVCFRCSVSSGIPQILFQRQEFGNYRSIGG